MRRMRLRDIAVLLLLTTAPAIGVHGQALVLPAQPGQAVSLAADDTRLELQKQQAWSFQAQPGGQQVVLNFRARIDNPSTVGSTNMLKIELNGQTVGLKTPRRQMRLLNKSNKFAWTDPPSLNWFIPPGQWRLAYACLLYTSDAADE